MLRCQGIWKEEEVSRENGQAKARVMARAVIVCHVDGLGLDPVIVIYC